MKIEKQFTTTTDTNKIIPTNALAYLPFSVECLATWSESTDLRSFLYDLYNGCGYSDIANYYFYEGKDDFLYLAEVFYENAAMATPAPASVANDDIPYFIENDLFGKMAKYMIAWDHTVGNILSEDSYFSLSHILETRTDLASSINLASKLFYRQSLLVLRGFLESIILPIYFCHKPESYKEWKSNSYHIPAMRGKNGLLNELEVSGLLPKILKEKVYGLYGDLNSYVHGAESSLNNAGLNDGQWSGYSFQYSLFEKWVEFFCSCVEVGIHTLRINHLQWEQARKTYGVFCNICHSKNLTISSNQVDIKKYKCNDCEAEFSMKNNQRVINTLIEIEDDNF